MVLVLNGYFRAGRSNRNISPRCDRAIAVIILRPPLCWPALFSRAGKSCGGQQQVRPGILAAHYMKQPGQ
jgi:hypothetical protein